MEKREHDIIYDLRKSGILRKGRERRPFFNQIRLNAWFLVSLLNEDVCPKKNHHFRDGFHLNWDESIKQRYQPISGQRKRRSDRSHHDLSVM